MKANEIEDGKVLMIGDLVVGCIETDIVGEATYKILCKVTDINHYGDVRCEALKPFPDELDWQEGDDFSWIESVPITSEILEKNGFEYKEGEIGMYGVTIAPHYICDDVPFEVFCDGEPFAIWFREPVNIKFVHQLQHAMRLCGITREIIL